MALKHFFFMCDFNYFKRKLNLKISFFTSHTSGKKLSVYFNDKGIKKNLHSYIVGRGID